MTRSVILMDTEFTSWEGAMATNWGEDWQHRELVQIAALKMNVDTFEILGLFDQLVKPVINPVLSDFLVDLTGISNEDVQEKGISFSAAYQNLIDFAAGDKVWCYGWDGKVIAENCDLNGTPGWREALDIDSLHAFFQKRGVDTSKVNSGKLSKYFGLDLEIHEHNAMDDVYSIHAALNHIKEQKNDTPF